VNLTKKGVNLKFSKLYYSQSKAKAKPKQSWRPSESMDGRDFHPAAPKHPTSV
jgi:hypothetical protein